MLWSKKKNEREPRIILGMVMLEDCIPIDKDALCQDLIENYDLRPEELSENDPALTFTLNGELVALVFIPMAIPSGDIEDTAEYAYNWPTAADDLKEHQAHILVSIVKGGDDQVERFRIFSQLICSILRTTNSVGVYKGNQSLLIPRPDYLEAADVIQKGGLPLNLWIYIGLRHVDGLNSGYTYGLKEFKKKELEIIDSHKSPDEIREFLFNISYYVLENDIEFEDGQTCGLSETDKIPITRSAGELVEGETFKLGY